MKAMPHRFRSGTDDDRFWHRAENLSSAITSAAIWGRRDVPRASAPCPPLTWLRKNPKKVVHGWKSRFLHQSNFGARANAITVSSTLRRQIVPRLRRAAAFSRSQEP
jgi:hypothetical protein